MWPLPRKLVLTALLAPLAIQAQGWEVLEPMPEGRAGMIAFVTAESEIAYYGGTAWRGVEKHVAADGFRLTATGWVPLEPLMAPIAYAPHGQNARKWLALGGLGKGSVLTRAIQWRMDGSLTETTLKTEAIAYAPGAELNGDLYSFGGSSRASPLAPSAQVLRLRNGRLSQVSNHPEGPILNAAACTWGQQIYIFGGGYPAPSGSLINRQSSWLFDVETAEWTRLPDLPEPVRGSVAVAVADHGILLLGGYAGGDGREAFSSNVWLFEPESRTFRRLPDLPRPLLLPAAVTTSIWLYVWGGEDAPKSRSNEAHRITLTDLGIPN